MFELIFVLLCVLTAQPKIIPVTLGLIVGGLFLAIYLEAKSINQNENKENTK